MLVMLLNYDNVSESSWKVFVPSGGPEPDTDELADWVVDLKVTELIPHKKIDTIPFKKSSSMCSQLQRGDFYFVTKRGDVEECDWLHFAGKERLEVYGVVVDYKQFAAYIHA